jgi:hypothetical protein
LVETAKNKQGTVSGTLLSSDRIRFGSRGPRTTDPGLSPRIRSSRCPVIPKLSYPP